MRKLQTGQANRVRRSRRRCKNLVMRECQNDRESEKSKKGADSGRALARPVPLPGEKRIAPPGAREQSEQVWQGASEQETVRLQ